MAVTKEQVVRDAFESKYGSSDDWVCKQDYDGAFDDFEAGYHAARSDLEAELEQLRAENEALKQQVE